MSDSLAEEDLLKLPRWARVAFAAKCGRRVQPLLRMFWPTAPAELLMAFDRAIALTEESAAQARLCDGLEEAAGSASQYRPAVPFRAPEAGPRRVPDSDIVRCAVAFTAEAAAGAAMAAAKGDDAACARHALDAFRWADHAARFVHVSGADAVLQHDFCFLRQATDRGELTDTSPVPPISSRWRRRSLRTEMNCPGS